MRSGMRFTKSGSMTKKKIEYEIPEGFEITKVPSGKKGIKRRAKGEPQSDPKAWGEGREEGMKAYWCEECDGLGLKDTMNVIKNPYKRGSLEFNEWRFGFMDGWKDKDAENDIGLDQFENQS